MLVGPGSTLADSSGLPLAARLAAVLELRLLPEAAVSAAVGGVGADLWANDPAILLAALAPLAPGWLLPLPLDPGADLAMPGCWAEALAAWRQPTLLVVPAPIPGRSNGLARAYNALLQTAGVPLLGLVQWGGAWDPIARRRDGLPWLGCLPADEAGTAQEMGLALRQVSRRRWQTLGPAPQRGQA